MDEVGTSDFQSLSNSFARRRRNFVTPMKKALSSIPRFSVRMDLWTDCCLRTAPGKNGLITLYFTAETAAFDLTWQGIEGWESYDGGRDLLKEIAGYLKTISTRIST